jgi:hypothetical protein
MMAKKHWIYLKRGLSADPKHRAQMGECVWLYMHIIDRADWETGIVHDWKDAEEAADMGMNVETLRAQRQKLDRLDYIRCFQKQHSQEIQIMEWINPRDYSGGVMNRRNEGIAQLPPSQGMAETPPSQIPGLVQGGSQGGSQVTRQDPTPTLDSESESSSDALALTEEEKRQANTLMDAILKNDRAPVMKYTNREKIEFSEDYLRYCDLYVSLCGKDSDGRWNQVPTQRVLQDWILAFEEWKQENLKPEHIRAAYAYATREDGGFLVARPAALTKTAVAMKTKLKSSPIPHVNQAAVDATKKRLEEQAKQKFVPRPSTVPAPRTGQTTLGAAMKGMSR